MGEYEKSTPNCAGGRLEKVDIKTDLKNSITWLESNIKESQERLRVKKQQLALVSKNKDLEAYLNLSRDTFNY